MKFSIKLALAMIVISLISLSGILFFGFYEWFFLIITKKEISSPFLTLEKNLFLVLIGVIIFIIISAFYFSRRFTRPVNELHTLVKEIEKGNFKSRVNIKSNDEFKELGNAFNKMTENLEKIEEDRKQVDKMKTEFMSITSHELRSPMTPMRAQLQMLLQGYFGKISDKQKNSLDLVSRNTERLDNIILDFLEISRIEAGRLKFNFVRTSLESHVLRLINEMKGFMPEKKIKLLLKISKLPVIEVDPDRVMQVLRNLINNAIKFSKINGKIWINVSLLADKILFIIKDEGDGIPKEDQIRIFEPFFQSGGMYDRKVGGTGLGLAICRGIVESQHGNIWFESEEKKGTTFYFTIPLTPEKEIAPIKLLFSYKSMLEPRIRTMLIDYLGPIANSEFEDLKSKGIDRKKLTDYIKMLAKKRILNTDKAEKLINEIKTLFSAQKINVGIKELKKSGLIKKNDAKKIPSGNIGEAATYVMFDRKKHKAILTDDGELIKLCKLEKIPFICSMAIILKLYENKKLTKEETKIKLNQLNEIGRYSKQLYEYFIRLVK